MNKLIHDSYVTGLVLDDTKLYLMLNDPENKKRIGKVVFNDIETCRFDYFRSGNIVLDLVIYKGSDVNKIDNHLCYVYDIDNSKLKEDWVIDTKNNIQHNNLVLALLQETYGLYGVVICKSIEIIEML